MDQKHTSDSLKFPVMLPHPYNDRDRYFEYINAYVRLGNARGGVEMRGCIPACAVEILFNSEQDRTFFLLNVSRASEK